MRLLTLATAGALALALTACSQKTEDHAAAAADQTGAAAASAARTLR